MTPPDMKAAMEWARAMVSRDERIYTEHELLLARALLSLVDAKPVAWRQPSYHDPRKFIVLEGALCPTEVHDNGRPWQALIVKPEVKP